MLAKMLREEASQRTPYSVRDPRGTTVYDPNVVAEQFHAYFSRLYSLPDTLPPDIDQRRMLLQDFLSGCQLPTLPAGAVDSLGATISIEEVAEVLKLLPSGKSPGPDGLTYLYYQTFKDQLLPYLTAVYNDFLGGESIPDSMLHSYISLIPKPDKDPLECANYRPIALLNSDLKIFTKILANRLSCWLPQLINKDQVGFVPCRQGGDNTRRAIDLIDIVNRREEPMLLLSLDAEKAFDRLNWSFMFHVLRSFGVGGPFLQALCGLYSRPSATIRLPHALSRPIFIRNGTRQGCPLSPLIFVLCIEPLAAAIRLNQDITGVVVGGREFKISLYADDVLLTLTNLHVTLPNLVSQLDSFGVLSGYKVNTSKTEALPINIPHDDLVNLQAHHQYQWKTTSLKYLGTHLTPSFSSLFNSNFPKLFREIRKMLHRWSSLPISFFGRIAAIKMTILPKLMYLFETLPIPVPRSELRAMQTSLIRFIWANKRHRILKSVLLTPRSHGGLAVPDILKYYWAVHLRRIPAWSSLYAYTRWMEIEKLWLAPIHPNSLLWSTTQVKIDVPLLGPMSLTRSIWKTCVKSFDLSSPASPLTSFLFHPLFPDGLGGHQMKQWFDRKLFRFADIIDPSTRRLMTFDILRRKYDLPLRCHYSYLQISHFMLTLCSEGIVSSPTAFERLCGRGSSTKGLISEIYLLLATPSPQNPTKHPYMLKWESYLGNPLPWKTWQIIWRRASKTSACVSYKENQYKILMFWYHTPSLLHSLFPEVPDVCWRCGVGGADLFHIFWDCPSIQGYWSTVQQLLQDVLGLQIALSPLTYLLNVPPQGLSRGASRLLLHMLTAVKCLIAVFWKRTAVPSLSDLQQRILEIRSMERLSASLANQIDLCNSVWSLWDLYAAEHVE